MASLPMRQSDAARASAIAWGCAALAAVAGAVVFMLPRAQVDLNAADAKQAEGAGANEAKKRVLPWEGLRTDWARLKEPVDRLRSPAIDAWKERMAAAASQPSEPAPGAQPAAGFAPPWRYLGYVVDGERRSALVLADNKQRFVTIGYTTPDNYRLIAIEPTQITVQHGASRHTIALVETARGRSLTSTTVGAPMPGGSTQQPYMNIQERPRVIVPSANPGANPAAAPLSPNTPGYPGFPQTNPVPGSPGNPSPQPVPQSPDLSVRSDANTPGGGR